MNTTNNTSKLVILGLMTGILLLMAYTPLGYLNIGPLAITFNVIPVAIAAITLGPAGGAAIGAVFGMTSFLQCIGTGVRIGKTRVRVQSSGFGTPFACIGVRPSGGAPFGRQFLTGQAHGSPYRLISRRKIK